MSSRALGPAVIAMAFWIVTPLAFAGQLDERPVKPAPALDLPDLDGRQRTLADFRDRVVLVNFWASWCRPCLQEMPSLIHLEQEMSDQPFSVVGVNVGESYRRAKTAARRAQLTFPVLLDSDSRVFEAWGAEVLPTTFLLDGNGKIRYVSVGPIDTNDAEIVRAIQALSPANHGSSQSQ